MSGLSYLKLGSTWSNIYNTTQLGNATKCHYAFQNFWGEPCNIGPSWSSCLLFPQRFSNCGGEPKHCSNDTVCLFENIMRKEENVGRQNFLPFPSCLLGCQREK